MMSRTLLLLLLITLILSVCHADDNGVCEESRVQCTGITCGFDIHTQYTTNNTGCECTEADIGRRYTNCDSNTDTKSLFLLYKPPATCIAKQPLPSPILDIPCNVRCEPGQRLDVSKKECVTCGDGHYSQGSAIEVKKWSQSKGLLAQMSTYCEAYSFWSTGCNKWVITEGGYLESGNNKQYNSIKSILEYHVEISEPMGTLTFEYMVSAEKTYDYLSLTIDTTDLRMKESESKPVDEWKIFSTNITQGYHTIRFIYSKDATIGEGYDNAKIRSLRLTGISEVPLNCTACEPGYFSKNGQPCTPCPPGQYSNEPGQDHCSLCPAGQSSFIGSTTCFQKSIPCQEHDYASYYEECQEGTTTKVYEWIKPQICNESEAGSAELPAPEEGIPCEVPTQCNPGQAPNATSYECDYCPAGQASPDGKKCITCSQGTAAEEREITIEKFKTRDRKWKDEFLSTKCSGECSSEWRFTDGYADSGLGNGVSDSWIDIDLKSIKARQIEIDFALTCSIGTGSLDIEVDGLLINSISCTGCVNITDDSFSAYKFDVEGAQSARINYKTRSLLSQDAFACDKAVISKIAIDLEDSSRGGSFECKACVAGEFTKDGTYCDICPAGTKSSAKSTDCKECEENTFSYEGSSVCHNCGNGMVSSPGSEECSWKYGTCHFNGTLYEIERAFDFEKLGPALEKVAATSTAEIGTTFYFNVCGDKHASRRSMKLIADEVHNNTCAALDGAYACKTTKSGEVIALGRSADIKAGLYGSDLSSESGIHLTFTDLSAKSCYNNETKEDSNYRVIVNLRCNSEQIGEYDGPEISMVDSCTYRADFITKYGCPLCDASDYVSLEGECDPKTLQKEIVYVKKTDIANRCYGGAEMPPKKVKCQVNVISAPYWIVAAVLGVALLIIIVLGGVAGFFYFKFKDVSSKFYRLSEDDHNVGTGRATEL